MRGTNVELAREYIRAIEGGAQDSQIHRPAEARNPPMLVLFGPAAMISELAWRPPCRRKDRIQLEFQANRDVHRWICNSRELGGA